MQERPPALVSHLWKRRDPQRALRLLLGELTDRVGGEFAAPIRTISSAALAVRSGVYPLAGGVRTFRGEVLPGAMRVRSRALRRLARPLLLRGSRGVERFPGLGVRALPVEGRADGGWGGPAVTPGKHARSLSTDGAIDRPLRLHWRAPGCA